MSWTALVPLKAAGARKTRLSPGLSRQARDDMAEAMFRHVVDVLASHTEITRIVVLAETPPPGWNGGWVADTGRGLNAELEAAASRLRGPLLVMHADLPELTEADLSALLAAAEAGAAIAPDRHGRGTNAMALNRTRIPFSFGPDSFLAHRTLLPDIEVVHRSGLACDVDTPKDLRSVRNIGDPRGSALAHQVHRRVS